MGMKKAAVTMPELCNHCLRFKGSPRVCRLYPYDRRLGIQRAVVEWIETQPEGMCPGFEGRPV